MSSSLPPELYYLENFRTALAWVAGRYADLLSDQEQAFICNFAGLALPAQALLVRMIMRKGPHFRASKLSYAEIGEVRQAALPLLQAGWLTEQALLTASEVAALLRKDELLQLVPPEQRRPAQKKDELLAHFCTLQHPARPFTSWCGHLTEQLYSLTIADLCERLQLLFFGNLAQDWSEFVLADLGIYRYETVAITPDSRGFRSREDIDNYLLLRAHRLRFEAGEAAGDVLESLNGFASENPHLQSRHASLLLMLAQQLEKQGELQQALALYERCTHADARWRQVRVLEKLERHAQAHALVCNLLAQQNSSEARIQQLQPALRRLQRKLGLPVASGSHAIMEKRFCLCLPAAQGSVEYAVREQLHSPQTPVYYVENSLFCSLFGLLCWEAIFAPLPGAFFHPFHSGPADLHSEEFHLRRAGLFDACLARLDSTAYQTHIRQMYQAKFGIQSPFVFWGVLDEQLLELALLCIPAAHLKACCTRLLQNIRDNRAGMPDLIQFYPQQPGYRMVEVKGPGDRLQDNQKRWMEFASRHGMPVEVCHVEWSGT
jgi:hypothetical protein